MRSAVGSPAKEGSVLGGILLIGGSCIGAGMLALPVITGVGGFIPSLVLFFIAWAFMTTTALLLLEANLTLGYQLSLISIAEKTLGRTGKLLCWVLFIFLFYSLNVAYIAASGSILQTVIGDLGWGQLPVWVGSVVFTAIFGIVIYVGTRPVDYLNRVLMVGLIVTYCALIFLGSLHMKRELLSSHQWKFAFASIPVLIISFGFHNMIPTLAQYFKGDVRRLKLTVLGGSLLTLAIYLVWEAVMLGVIPLRGPEGLLKALDQGTAATCAFRAALGKSWVSTVGNAFALFAITTSFLAQSLSLVDFLSDGMKVSKEKMGRVLLLLVTLVPPFILALVYPGIFIRALNIAGGFSAVVLFGIMPAVMIWILRYRREGTMVKVIPTGRLALCLVLLFAAAVFLLETAQEFGISILPQPVCEALL